MTQNIQNGSWYENGFQNVENYRRNRVGDFSWRGEDKNCQTSGWGIQLPTHNSSERGEGEVCLNENLQEQRRE